MSTLRAAKSSQPANLSICSGLLSALHWVLFWFIARAFTDLTRQDKTRAKLVPPSSSSSSSVVVCCCVVSSAWRQALSMVCIHW